MDRWLQESVTKGDVSTLRERIEQDETIVRQTVPGSLNTILHLSARFGYVEYAKEVLNRCPDMVSMENADLETPLYEACRQGHLEIVKLILETDPWIVYKVNSRMESAFFAACEKGKIDIVKHFPNSPQLLMLEMDMDTNSLHVAASSGFTEIVKEILNACPDLAWKKNSHGCTPLHLSCSKGHLQITREFLQLDSDLCLVQDIQGRTPLHWAVIRGRMNVIHEILSFNLEYTEMTTHSGESILHLGVKNNQYEVVKYLTETLSMSRLLNLPDSDGNTVLHLATAGKLTAMVTHLLKIGVDVNALNGKGYTALDVIEADASHSGLLAIVPALMEAGSKRCDQLSPGSINIQQVAESTMINVDERSSRHKTMSWPNKTPEYQSPRHHQHRPSRQRRKKLDLQNEGVRNARKTITIVAVLIATVTFAAGINPPGGFDQRTGITLRGNRAGFKVFLACNIVALFLSLGVVNVLVSIIPFTRKNMMQLLSVTHKIMWASSIFMIAAYIAAVWTTMPDGRGPQWVLVELIFFGGGSTVVLFVGLCFLLARHWHNKYKWRKFKQKKTKDESPKSSTSRVEELRTMKNGRYSSSNSDVDSSDQGYHLY
ncbi:uncharacterized protein LOC142555496 [Primulina tabacum]|uniref:uncharacterized protein LOC142555496 n=1 Tax=Primulina tabacum TaxID=48773 RepID=UPI003F5ACC64